jgi:hypothetical protein
MDSLQTITQYVLAHLDKMTPAGLMEQQQKRKTFQRKGYANMVYEILGRDGLGALFSFIRTRLHVEYSMAHKIYWIVPPMVTMGSVIPGVPFPDVWSFPEDPWSKQ